MPLPLFRGGCYAIPSRANTSHTVVGYHFAPPLGVGTPSLVRRMAIPLALKLSRMRMSTMRLAVAGSI
jgi:hypothetical protein